MNRARSYGLVWGLLLCLVLVNGSMAAPSVAHAAQHGAHKAGTHSSGFCAWLCAAGQGIEVSPVRVDAAWRPFCTIELQFIEELREDISFQPFLRGPPAL